MGKINWKLYIDEITSLSSKGHSSGEIFKRLKDKYPDVAWPDNGDRSIRNNLNKFKQTLGEHNFEGHTWKTGWLKTPHASIQIVNPELQKAFNPDKFAEDFRALVQKDLPKFKRIKRSKGLTHALVIDIADLHIGKYASIYENREAYDSDKAIQIAEEGLSGILNKVVGHAIERIIFVIGNDVLHVEAPTKATAKGTPQDVSGMWYDNYLMARDMYIRALKTLVQVADVQVVFCPSNHDFASGYHLAEAVNMYFYHHDNISFVTDMRHRKYIRWHNNLIGLSHGDGAKMEEMPLLMANEAKQEWAETDYRYVYLHHIHHKDYIKFRSGKDYNGVTVEYLRSPSPADAWHSKEGYVGAKKAIEAFVHDRNHGQVDRISHNFT